jgi:hypothetical protein
VQAQIANWRGLLTGSVVVDGRQLLREVLEAPLRFVRDGPTYRFTAPVAVWQIIAGAVLRTCEASPRGFEPVSWKGAVPSTINGMSSSANLASLVRARVEGFVRFAEWEASHPAILTPADAIAAIGTLYQLLPPASRRRSIDATGVGRMHDALRHLSR